MEVYIPGITGRTSTIPSGTQDPSPLAGASPLSHDGSSTAESAAAIIPNMPVLFISVAI